MMARTTKTKNEILQDLADEWCEETGSTSINTTELANWMMRERGWQPQRADAISVIKKELQVALREWFITDPQGRRVRLKHAQRVTRELKDGSHEQFMLWRDIRKATRPQMQAAFQQRRFGVVMDCHRLKIDVESYNQNWNNSVNIQIEFDFTDDMYDLDHDAGEPDD